MSISRDEDNTRGRPKKTGLIRDESQEAKALKLLIERSRGGRWTEARELSERVSLQYSRVIWSLRKRGFRIENRVEVVDGTRFGYFRLISEVPGSESQGALFRDAVAYRDPEEARR